MTAHVLSWALSELSKRNTVVLATVLNTSGSVPGKTGARLAMSSDGKQWRGTVGGAGLEHRVLARCGELLSSAKEPAAEVLTYGLNKGAKGYEVTPLDSLCGGRVTISIEVMIPMPHVLIMGGGHCGEALSEALARLGWSFSIHDTRPAFASAELYPDAVERVSCSVTSFFAEEDAASLRRFSDVLLLGHDWSEDQERLLLLLHRLQAGGCFPTGKMAPASVSLEAVQNGRPSKRHALRRGFPLRCWIASTVQSA